MSQIEFYGENRPVIMGDPMGECALSRLSEDPDDYMPRMLPHH